jgi:DNA-binding Xre family transcriptional regulator
MNRLKELISKKGYTITYVAKKIGVNKSTLHRWMSDTKSAIKIEDANVSKIMALCKALNCKVEDLVTCKKNDKRRNEKEDINDR